MGGVLARRRGKGFLDGVGRGETDNETMERGIESGEAVRGKTSTGLMGHGDIMKTDRS
jgi:hypothetical protein